MSALAEPQVTTGATPAAPAAAPAAPAKTSHLPSGVKVDHSHDATTFFEAHKAANAPAPVAPAPAAPPAGTGTPTLPPPPPPRTDSAPAPAIPKKDDVTAQLTQRFLPDSAKPPEPAPAPAPGPEANPEDRVVLDKSFSPAAQSSFAAIKTIAKGLRDQLLTRDAELTTTREELARVKAGASTVLTPEVQKKLDEYEAMSKRLMVLDLQNHPQFQQQFVAPRSAAEQEAAAILAAHGVQVDIEGLLSKNPVDFRKALSDVAAKLPTALDQADFATAMRTAHTLKQRGDQAIQNAGQLNQDLRQQTVQGHKQAFEDVYGKTVGALKLSELRAPTGATPEQLSEIEAYNNGIRGLRTEAEKIALGTSDPRSIASASLKAAAYDFHQTRVMPMMLKVIAGKDGEIAALTAQITGLRARNPNRDMRGIDGGGEGVDPSKMDNHQAADYWFNKK